jgi:hypothetical protein
VNKPQSASNAKFPQIIRSLLVGVPFIASFNLIIGRIDKFKAITKIKIETKIKNIKMNKKTIKGPTPGRQKRSKRKGISQFRMMSAYQYIM